MALTAWTDYNHGSVSRSETDTVEWPEIVVLEGLQAEESILRHFGRDLSSTAWAFDGSLTVRKDA